jgi:hypothetical protein
MKDSIYLHTNWGREKFIEVEEMIPCKKDSWDFFQSNDKDSKIQIFEDVFLPKHKEYSSEYIKIAFLKENPDIYAYSTIHSNPYYHPYEYVLDNISNFDYVITAFKNLKPLIGEKKFIYCPVLGSRIEEKNYGIYDKSKLLSIIASQKDWTVGHRFRHWIIQKYKNEIDVYGRGYNTTIDDYGKFGKIYALAPYYFSLAVMNTKQKGYFTEVLTDVIATGTIPIFYGDPDISSYFNPNGIIHFNSFSELDYIIKNLSKELYDSKIEAVKENLEICKKYINDIDYLYGNYQEKFKKMLL